jgi:hypothetical protein
MGWLVQLIRGPGLDVLRSEIPSAVSIIAFFPPTEIWISLKDVPRTCARVFFSTSLLLLLLCYFLSFLLWCDLPIVTLDFWSGYMCIAESADFIGHGQVLYIPDAMSSPTPAQK